MTVEGGLVVAEERASGGLLGPGQGEVENGEGCPIRTSGEVVKIYLGWRGSTSSWWVAC